MGSVKAARCVGGAVCVESGFPAAETLRPLFIIDDIDLAFSAKTFALTFSDLRYER